MPSFSGNILFILGFVKLYFEKSMYYKHHLHVYLCQRPIFFVLREYILDFSPGKLALFDYWYNEIDTP